MTDTAARRPCMTEAEHRAWMAANAVVRAPRPRTPCVDCTLNFCEAMRAIGRCDSTPRGRGLPTTDPRVIRRRQQYRDYYQRRRMAAA